ncbi:MAG: FAD:protein FMN transferase [Clostridia bacterium]|nr:FAD:protein FMN transferase [Clostridia bacterium]
MKKFFAGVAAAVIAVAACSPLCACTDSNESYYKVFYAMDTAAQLVAAKVDKSDFDKVADKVERLLSSAEQSLSTARSNSYISIFNRASAGERVELDEVSFEVLSLAKEVYAETDGFFNPAVYYCEDLYGFAARGAGAGAMPYDRAGEKPTLPDDKYVTAFKELSTHFSEVEIFELGGVYYATKPDFTAKIEGDEREYSLALDLGGIAKGWCVDKVNGMLEEAGIEYGYFSFGVSSMGVGKSLRADGKYDVLAGDPRSKGGYLSFAFKDDNLSTSGDHFKFYEIDGVRYCHVIDPRTGSPVRTGVASVTLVGGSAGRADALTTALAAMGKTKAAEFINTHLSDCKVAMLIFEDGAGKILTNAPDYFTVENKNYVLANTVVDGKIVLNSDVA